MSQYCFSNLNDSDNSTNMSSSQRLTSLSTYVAAPPTFASQVGDLTPLQVDEDSQYASTPELSSETDLLPPVSNSLLYSSSEYGILGARTTATVHDPSKIRVMKAPRIRRRARSAKAAEKSTGPEITQPLSYLTRHMTHIPVKDMNAWVTRSVETRKREVEVKNGKIARPMNSFMLYRSAYAERTKEWCSQNNHQVVSRVSGLSWPMEPPEVREKYETLALIERDNHQRAHPDYKFAPNKTQTPPRKKRSVQGDSSEGDDSDARGSSHGTVPKKVNTSGFTSSLNSRGSTPLDQDHLLEGYHPSAWVPAPPRNIPQHMYPQPGHTYYSQITNVMRSPGSGQHVSGTGMVNQSQYATSTGLVGIPGGVHQELVQPFPNGTTVSQVDEHQLDPQLLSSTEVPQRTFNWPSDPDLSNTYLGFEGIATYVATQPMEEQNPMMGFCHDGELKELDFFHQQAGYPAQ